MANVTSDTPVPKGQSAYPLSGTGTLIWADNPAVDQTPCAGQPLQLNVSST